MKIVTLSLPPPFLDGPQYDEEGNLIPGSWPAGLPHEGMLGWVNIGIPKGGLGMVEFICEDDWPIGDIPGGWVSDSSHRWDGVTQDEYDENGDFVSSALKTDQATNEVQYTTHIPPPTDENGDPTGDPAVYHRIHSYQGWPVVRD